MELFIFLIIFLVLAMTVLRAFIKTPNFVLGTVFLVILIIGAAFYLFQFGSLSSFTIKGLSAEASFVKEKVREAEEDAAAINAIRNEVTKVVEDVKKSEAEISQIRNSVVGIKGDLVKVERNLAEIQYLTYIGRGHFPNPHHKGINKLLNELLVIAIPDPKQRAVFIKKLKEYEKSREKTK